mgnify:CR=1 FL=1
MEEDNIGMEGAWRKGCREKRKCWHLLFNQQINLMFKLDSWDLLFVDDYTSLQANFEGFSYSGFVWLGANFGVICATLILDSI